MTLTHIPEGEERQVQTTSVASIDGAPVAYIVVLAAVTAALAFIPFTIILASGGGMPMSQFIYPLLGWILGPLAGGLASGMGMLIGAFFAPYTAGMPIFSVTGAFLGSFTAGAMVLGYRRKYWWLGLTILFTFAYCFYVRQALHNGVSPKIIFLGSFIDWSGLVLFALPTRTLFARWINSNKLIPLIAGLFLGTWTVSGVGHLSASAINYYLYNWPEEIWIALIPIMPVENLFRCVGGTIIGVGVISGLREINLVKPREAIY
ncbi:hypothetical protein [Gloeothece verrucosa]|uniref:Signal transduction histidine kinase, LytS n=1 Tax=Gloeothece verrucosa (strain PCC 7822) TaxID=497965 RepID=E0UEB2_GLOV7|nr:hypothetical protein [Gloeothece verrucosa]ADN14237.1 conserved hypothetical protein [Gloeothece verrucosa PCC 7822]